MRERLERRLDLVWCTYRWADGPKFHLVIGASNRADTIFEVGVLGRCFCVARRP